ncbi:hypothetical protein EDC96DRAFT_512709 [Choanephora cucurbitarum]|nr:hypothetical protein EDC96DRAFT_512709 [Choanephora cucurbitarum]
MSHYLPNAIVPRNINQECKFGVVNNIGQIDHNQRSFFSTLHPQPLSPPSRPLFHRPGLSLSVLFSPEQGVEKPVFGKPSFQELVCHQPPALVGSLASYGFDTRRFPAFVAPDRPSTLLARPFVSSSSRLTPFAFPPSRNSQRTRFPHSPPPPSPSKERALCVLLGILLLILFFLFPLFLFFLLRN